MSGEALAYAPAPTQQIGVTDRILQLLDIIDVRLMESGEEREAVARLRYDAYRREDTIAPNPRRTFADPYDDKGNCWIFGLYIGDELASSVRIHVANQHCPIAPSLSVFPDVLEPPLQAGEAIVDPTRLVTDDRLSRLYTGLPQVTTRLCWMAAEHFDAPYLLGAVRAEHQAFYKRVFSAHLLCGARDYPLLTKPITLMVVNYRDMMERVHRRYPFLRSTFFERRMLFERHVPAPALPSQPYIPHGGPALNIAAQAS